MQHQVRTFEDSYVLGCLTLQPVKIDSLLSQLSDKRAGAFRYARVKPKEPGRRRSTGPPISFNQSP